MKRPHRRAHLLLWLILFPSIFVLSALILLRAPIDLTTALPDDIATEAP